MDNKAWNDFVHWCQVHRLNAVPANSWTIAAYVRWCEPHMKPSVIAKAIMEINRVHESKTRKRIYRDPLVKRTLKMIVNRNDKAQGSVKLDLFDDSLTIDTQSLKKRKNLSSKSSQKRRPKSSTVGRLKRGLNSSPRLVSRRKLVR